MGAKLNPIFGIINTSGKESSLVEPVTVAGYDALSITHRNSTREKHVKPRRQRLRAEKSYHSKYAISSDWVEFTCRAITTYTTPSDEKIVGATVKPVARNTWSEQNAGKKVLTSDKNRVEEIKLSTFYNAIEANKDATSIQIADNILLTRQHFGNNLSKPKCNRFYTRFYDIFIGDDTEPFAEMLCLPNDGEGSKLSFDFVQIKIFNYEFYRETSRGLWAAKLAYVLSELDLEINSIVRWDIAIDGLYLMDIFRRRVLKRDIIFKGHNARKKLEHCHAWDADGKPAQLKTDVELQQVESERIIENGTGITGVYVGSSSKRACAYQKGLRIEVENKMDLAKFWHLNSVITDATNFQEVERIELRLRNENVRTIEGFEQPKRVVKIWNASKMKYVKKEVREAIPIESLLKMQDEKFLAGVLQSQFKNWLEFVPATGDSNKSRRPTIEFINWKKIEKMEVKRLSIIRKPSDVWLNDRMTKGLLTFSENPNILERVKNDLPGAINSKSVDCNYTKEFAYSSEQMLRFEISKEHFFKIPDGALDAGMKEFYKQSVKHFLINLSSLEVKEILQTIAFSISGYHGREDWLQAQNEGIARKSEAKPVKVKLGSKKEQFSKVA